MADASPDADAGAESAAVPAGRDPIVVRAEPFAEAEPAMSLRYQIRDFFFRYLFPYPLTAIVCALIIRDGLKKGRHSDQFPVGCFPSASPNFSKSRG